MELVTAKLVLSFLREQIHSNSIKSMILKFKRVHPTGLSRRQFTKSTGAVKLFGIAFCIYCIKLLSNVSTQGNISEKESTFRQDVYFASRKVHTPIIYFNQKNAEIVQLEDAVFFLETSGRVFHSPRELCAVESAARHHPNKTIVVGTTSPYLLNTALHVAVTSRHKNVHLVRFNFTALSLRTPLKDWLLDRKDHPLRSSKAGVEHMSDIARAIVLYIYGGIYMDTDVIVLKSLAKFRNALPLAHHLPGNEITNCAFMAMDRGHQLLGRFLEDIRLK